GDQRATCVRQIELAAQRRSQFLLQVDAEEPASDLSLFNDRIHHIASQIDRYGEADTLKAAAAAQDGGIDPDQAPLDIDQRTAGVAHIDRGIGLDEVFVSVNAKAAAANGADDAGRDGATDVERITDGHHCIADFE